MKKLFIALAMLVITTRASPVEYKPLPEFILLQKKIALRMEWDKFCDHMALIESSCNYDTISKHGYIGGFQFHPVILHNLGAKVSLHRFKKDKKIFPKEMQRYYFMKLSKINYYYMRNYVAYEGKYIKGVKITKSGLMAACHLAGPTHVKAFLLGKYDFKDANGTRVSSYIKMFNGYEI